MPALTRRRPRRGAVRFAARMAGPEMPISCLFGPAMATQMRMRGDLKDRDHAGHDFEAGDVRGAEPDRRGHRHVPADPCAARRSGGLFRRAGRDQGGDRADPREARPRQAADRAVRQLRQRPRARRPRQFADHRPAGRQGDQEPAAGLGRADAARPDRIDTDRGAAWHRSRRRSPARCSITPAAWWRRPACRCRCSSPG